MAAHFKQKDFLRHCYYKTMMPVIMTIMVINYFLQMHDRSSHCRCSMKIAILKNLAILTEKQLCWSLFY